ncbi:MAG: ABC transporter permease [Bacilli bacterium]|nr:ABC transporter permease [Bacilli bacterium]
MIKQYPLYEQYEVAKIEDYGYKEHRFTKILYKIIRYLVIIFAVFLMYIPIFTIFLQSINSSTITSEFGSVTLKWYVNIFTKGSLLTAIRNTVFISIWATMISTLLGTLFAIGISTLERKTKRHIMLLNNIPLLNADIVSGIGLMLIFSSLVHFFPYFFGWKTMLLAHIFFTLPYVVLSVLPKLREIDPNLFEASLDLGVKPYPSLYKVIIPAIKAGIFSGMILAFTMSFDDFVISYYTTGNGFDNLSIWIYSSMGRKSLSPSVYAFSTLVTIVFFALLIISNLLQGRRHHNENN